jgi:hypothetical protein
MYAAVGALGMRRGLMNESALNKPLIVAMQVSVLMSTFALSSRSWDQISGFRGRWNYHWINTLPNKIEECQTWGFSANIVVVQRYICV